MAVDEERQEFHEGLVGSLQSRPEKASISGVRVKGQSQIFALPSLEARSNSHRA